MCGAQSNGRSAKFVTQLKSCHGLKKRAGSTQHRPAARKNGDEPVAITIKTIASKEGTEEGYPLAARRRLAFGAFSNSHRRSVSFTWSRMGHMAPDLKASYVQLAGRLDYTAVVKQSDGKGVWSCEHITHHDPSSATECARREVARRTGPEKGSQR